MTKAAIYIRLSKETATTVSPVTQLNACRKLIVDKGWEEAEVFEDIDVSGSTDDRPSLKRLRASFGDLDAVVFYKVDRLSRSVIHFHEIMADAEAASVALVSATEPLDLSTPMGRAFAGVIAIFAELEREQIRARIIAGQATLLQKGRFRGGPVPFGWRIVPHPDGAGSWLALDPGPAAQLREAIGAVLSPGGSLVSAVRVFFGPTPSPADFTTVAQWMRSKRLIGQAEINTRDRTPAVVRGDDGLPVLSNEPLIDDELYASLQHRLGRQDGPARQQRSRLLSGVVFCASCHRTLHASGPDADPRYRCARIDCPHRMTVRAETLEDLVEEMFLKKVGAAEVVTVQETGGDLHAEERNRLEQALEDLAREMAQGSLTAGAYARAAELVEGRLAGLPPAEEPETVYVPTGERYRAVWGRSSMEERREILRFATEMIVVSPGQRGRKGIPPERVEFVWVS